MPIYYATTDSDGDYINEDAYIAKFDTNAEARDYLLQAHALDETETLEFRDGQFADAWQKARVRPRVGDGLLAPFTFNQVRVQRPGTHPGGNMWWLTPSPDVLILRIAK